jgi:hypothetical protein
MCLGCTYSRAPAPALALLAVQKKLADRSPFFITSTTVAVARFVVGATTKAREAVVTQAVVNQEKFPFAPAVTKQRH